MRRILLAATCLLAAGYAEAAPKGVSAAPKSSSAATKSDSAAPKDDSAALKDDGAELKDDSVAHKGNGVGLALDEVRTLSFKNPIATVYVGNPAVADVTMIDARHAFIQGKSYGRTNIVALNKDNEQVFNTHVAVTGGGGGGTVTLNRGAQRITLTCGGGRCEPTPTPGDDSKTYDTENNQLNTHQNAARTMAQADSKPVN
jgi:Flp pilus assembly secretin CpaC